ncbi:serine peptidase, family S28 [Morchella snyderi]|nr:serine peptidase, family S28 [Morchella snyderi]
MNLIYKHLSLIVLVLLYVQSAQAFRPWPILHHRELDEATIVKDNSAEDSSSENSTLIDPQTVTLHLDHFGNNTATFNNRYWVLEEFYKSGGPIFLIDVGESNALFAVDYYLKSNITPIRDLARKFNAMVILWEHRYYGKSTPYNITNSTTPEQMQYLTTAQALADLPEFAHTFERPNWPLVPLTPDHTPWVIFGGSYSGMRAAFARAKYPTTFLAAYASSAPVQARIDMSVYFEQIARGIVESGFENCTKDMRAAVQQIDKQLRLPATAAELKRMFLGKGSEGVGNGGFGYTLSLVLYNWQAWGMESCCGNEWGLRNFCDYMETDPETNVTVGVQGWAKEKGVQWVIDRWAQWPKFIGMVNKYMGKNCEGYHGTGNDKTINCDKFDAARTNSESISWAWTICSEWGFIQSVNLGPNQIVSRYLSQKYGQDLCYHYFPTGVSSGFLPEKPQVEKVNEEFGGWDMTPSNTFFTGGKYDPWTPLSVLSSEKWAPQHVISHDIPTCGVPTSENKIFGYLMKNTVHSFDIFGGKKQRHFPEVKDALNIFSTALKEWLECYDRAYRLGVY